jgi:hypothetical protein
METPNQKLVDYIKERIYEGASVTSIKAILLENEWDENIVDEAFSSLGVDTRNNNQNSESISTDSSQPSTNSSFARESITMDKIIEKFIPIVGALFLIIGFGYLIYANAWVNLSMEIRITLGFFFSVVLIGSSFSFSEKMRYFADIGIGSGVLLFYGTLIYSSRTTELAVAMIPEMVTLITAAFFTIAVSYFASKRNSKVILILGMVGAYITPFVIGQNDVWVDNISFNAYLLYFFAINVAVFLMGREISVRDIIPLNIAGLFLGVSTLWGLSTTDKINTVTSGNIFSGEVFTGVLFMMLVVFSTWSILLSAQKFLDKDDGYLSLGYIAPIIWFVFNIANLTSLSDNLVGTLYAVIAFSCFAGWHYTQGTSTRLQHGAMYASGLISAFMAVFAFFQEFNVITSMLMTYTSLIFGLLYVLDTSKTERFISYLLVSVLGSVLSLFYILDENSRYETLLIVIALVPAMSAYFIARYDSTKEYIQLATAYSAGAAMLALLFIISDFLEYVDIDLIIFYLTPLAFLTYVAFAKLEHDSRSKMLKLTMYWFAFGFATTFFMLVESIYPAPTNTFIFTNTNLPTDWLMIKGVIATVILFLGLHISRRLQSEQVVPRPSFILVIFGFATLLLTGNYIIYALMNDFSVSMAQGGPRAIATTLWWASIAIYMLYAGIRLGKKYHAEKLLGLLLLGITLIKVILYDIQTMGMQNKIVILMIVGGAMLMFSYRVKSKGLLKSSDDVTQN